MSVTEDSKREARRSCWLRLASGVHARRPLAALAFLLFGVAQVSAVMHAAVEHRRCAHGEWVDVDGRVAHAAPAMDADDSDALRALGVENDDHAHCVVCCEAVTVGVVHFDVVTDIVAFDLVALVGVFRASAEQHTVAPLVNAPKTSPPAPEHSFPLV